MEESKTPPVDPEFQAEVLRYMKANPEETRYYWRMLRHEPERALQEIMCRRMSRMEEMEQLADLLKPLVMAWVQQTPGLHEYIEVTLKTKVLFPSVAYIEEAVRAKTRLDGKAPESNSSREAAA